MYNSMEASGAMTGFGMAQNPTYGATGFGANMGGAPQKLPNNYDSEGNGLTEYYLTRLAPEVMESNSIGMGNYGAMPQINSFEQGTGLGFNAGTTGFGTSSVGIGGEAFGEPATSFPSAPAFGNNMMGASTGFSTGAGFGQGVQGEFGTTVNSTAELDALSQSLDAAKLMRTGKLLESIRSDLGLEMPENPGSLQPEASAAPDEKGPAPQTQQLLNSLHEAIFAQKQSRNQPKFEELLDYSHTQMRHNSAFAADFGASEPAHQFSRIGSHHLESGGPSVLFLNPRAPRSSRYTTLPSIQHLQTYSDQMLESVSNFVIHCYKAGKLVGSIRFLYPVNLLDVDLDAVVNIDLKCCNLQFGQQTACQLNAPAEVTLYDVFCPPGVEKADYAQTIEEITAANGGRLVEWAAERGVWQFSVNGFLG